MPVADIEIAMVGPERIDDVLPLVQALLNELGDEACELDGVGLLAAWREARWAVALLASTRDGEARGVLTLVEAFAMYAGGAYGIISEMYVAPELRGEGVGAGLIAAARAAGQRRGWRRIDVTAPESERWVRSRRFYERQGFVFTGPKLKLLLEDGRR